MRFEKLEQIQELIELRVPENNTLEYKEIYTGKDNREIAIDISAFANLYGGNILVGIPEKDGLPIKISGIPKENVDSLILKIENIVKSSIEPKIVGFNCDQIDIDSKNVVIIINVPDSRNAPHRVTTASNKYYIRNSNGRHEASITELEEMFNRMKNLNERVDDFRKARINHYLTDENFRGDSSWMVLHIIPLDYFQNNIEINLKKAESHLDLFVPVGGDSASYHYNIDGLVISSNTQVRTANTNIFRDGTIEVYLSPLCRTDEEHGNFVSTAITTHKLIARFPGYLDGLQLLGINPPFIVSMSLHGIRNSFLDHSLKSYNTDYDRQENKCDRELINIPNISINSFGDKEQYMRDLLPLQNLLWNAFGYDKFMEVKADGTWIYT